jgi:hypothetical protein
MKKILLGMAAVSALAVGAPAAAQYQNNGYQNRGYQDDLNVNGNLAARIGQLQGRIQAGVRSGAISQQEAVSLRQQLRDLTRIERQYSRDGLSGRERADLQLRIRNLRQQIRYAEGSGQGRYGQNDRDERYGDYDDRQTRVDRNGDGWDDRDYDRDGRWDDDQPYGRGDRVDRNGDGWDDRDHDRDGRWDDDQQDDRYEQPAQRGGIGGVIDSVLGRGGLRVGQRVSGNLYGVPYEYRGQYRDGNGVYYRSDGRNIYQIDARTDVVLRIFAMRR